MNKHFPECKRVPELDVVALIEHDPAAWLTLAEGKSALNPNTEREGVVFRRREIDPDKTFKAVSNKYLLKQKD